jgi:Ner family transcriptional regulator
MAEIRRRGGSLRQIAREAGLEKSACSAALIRPLPSAEVAISEYLRLPLTELWPDRYPVNPGLVSGANYEPKPVDPASLNAASPQTLNTTLSAAE